MTFNRGNKMINCDFKVGSTPIENVKTFTYLGFSISAKNCNFQPTIDDLSIKATRAIFSLTSKMKLSKLPTKIAIKIFNSQIVPILLYGSEIWGPYLNIDFASWEKNKIERKQTQFLKQTLGCYINTSNIMVRGETGCRPLLNQIIKRYISYYKNLKTNKSNLCHDALCFELHNSDITDNTSNFLHFLREFNLNSDILLKTKFEISNICNDAYDRLWKQHILNENSKGISYRKYKTRIHLEPYLSANISHKNKISLSRFRLSNHLLMIEKGRHVKPKIKRDERFCFICKNKVENEEHLLISCPMYTTNRILLENMCRLNCYNYDSLNQEQKFIFIMSNENVSIIKSLGKFVLESLTFREKFVEYFFS